MKNLHEAECLARATFGTSVQRVTLVPNANGRLAARVTMVGEVLHWLSPKGRHEKEVCCRPLSRQEQQKVEVVRR